jgi:hypothetical protein
MIENPTVIVLGAGASVQYGYPLGSVLKDDIVQGRLGNLQFEEIWWRQKREELYVLRQDLAHSGEPSVDAFLEHRTDLIDIGKIAIAAVIMRCEKLDLLFSVKESLYEYLYMRMKTSPDKFRENKVSILTFNYDRSLETYLVVALSKSYKISLREASNLLPPIIHLHGRVGPLPWESGDGREYSPSEDQDEIRKAAQSIKIIHENIDITCDENFSLASKLLSEVDRVCILGFGYNPINLERLCSTCTYIGKSKPVFYGSCFDYTDNEKSRIANILSQYSRSSELGHAAHNSVQFLRHCTLQDW